MQGLALPSLKASWTQYGFDPVFLVLFPSGNYQG